jgi:hypothetical protein
LPPTWGSTPPICSRPRKSCVDEHTIGLQPDGDTADSDLVFFTVLGTPDAAQLARISRTLLEANNFWVGTGGCTLGVQRDSGAVTLCGRIAVGTDRRRHAGRAARRLCRHRHLLALVRQRHARRQRRAAAHRHGLPHARLRAGSPS